MTAPWPRAFAAASASSISAAPTPSWREDASTASGPRMSAGMPPALTCHHRTDPITRPWRTADKARPSAGARPSRRRWQVRIWRLSPKQASSSASRAATSEARSARIANGAASEMRAAVVFRKAVMARQSSLRTAVKPQSVVRKSGKWGCGSRRTGSLYSSLKRGCSDVIGLQRRDAVERHRRVGRRIGPGAFDQQLVDDLERHRKRIRALLVQHVGAVAGRAGEHARGHVRAVMRGADGVTDRLVHGLGQTAELADVQVHPAHLVLVALLRDEHDLGFDDAGVAHHAATRLDDGLRNLVAEVLAQRAEDRAAVGHDRRHVLQVLGRETPAHVDHGQVDAALGAVAEYLRGHRQRTVPRLHLALLRADMEGDDARLQAQALGDVEHLDSHFRVAAELARQRPFGAGAVIEDAAEHLRAGSGTRDL